MQVESTAYKRGNLTQDYPNLDTDSTNDWILTNASAILDNTTIVRSGNTSFVTSNAGWTGSGTNVVLTNSGDKVGIGTSSPNHAFVVIGNINISGSGKGIYFPDGTFQNISASAPNAPNPFNTNLLLSTFLAAEAGNFTTVSIVDGVVNGFADESGINTGSSTNEFYDAANDLYSSSGVQNEGIFSRAHSSYVAVGDGVTGYQFVGMTRAVSNTGTIASIKVGIGTVTTSGSFTAEIWTDNAGTISTQVGGASDSQSISTTGTKTFTWSSNVPSVTSGTKYWVVFAGASDGGNVELSATADGTGIDGHVNDVKASLTESNWNFRIGIEINVSANMTLISNSATAGATPAEAHIVIFEEDVDATTLNTDLTGSVSRDGGTTFTQVTLSDKGNYTSGKRLFSGTADISSQPSGTNMVWNITTNNNKELRIHGVGMEWR